MSFTSFSYMWFLAAFTAVYWMVAGRPRQRNSILVLVSYFFYGFLSPWYCLLLMLSTIATYWCIEVLQSDKHTHRRTAVAASAVVNIGMLVFFKYTGFFAEEIAAVLSSLGLTVTAAQLAIVLPIGLAFYTLQAVGLVIDVYRKQVHVENLLEVSAYLSFFPKLIAGPFEPAKTFFPQLASPKKFKSEYLSGGIELILYGLFKKLVIAENIRPYIDQVFMLKNPSMTILAVGCIGFAIQILADFSGYTDIARGSARLLGFDLMENFKFPYLSLSPSDFWRRWHISLSQWFRDYVYIPLGGSRVDSSGKLCMIFMITMGLSGLWHGASANYLVWGLYHGALLFGYSMVGISGKWKPSNEITRGLTWLLMTFFTLFGWLLFRAPSMEWLVFTFQKMTPGLTQTHIVLSEVWLGMYAAYALPWVIVCLLKYFYNENVVARAVSNAIVILCLVYLSMEVPANFVYFQF